MDIQIFYRIKEEIDLNLALKFLKSPFLEKKLKGLNEINEIIEKVDNHEFQNTDKTYYLTPNILADWLISNKILEMLIGELHIEILKRCPEVIKFLCK
jgi:ubiquitin carboxyl-terminal hydrolase 9/24